jgi:phosphate transport system substrate-binding protein
MKRRRRLAFMLATTALALGVVAAGCGDDDDDGDGEGLSGSIVVDGSSTVAPLTSAAAEAFNAENPDVQIEVRVSGTGGGFEVFCSGETDISDASRPIKDDEVQACADGGVEYQEIRVGSDGITVVTGADADVGGDALTIEQLNAIWEPNSTINNWRDIPGGAFNDVELGLAGADSQSGTYDFFNEEVLGEDANGDVIEPRQDYAASADDNQTIRSVTGAPGGMGYFGYSYFAENQDQLAAFSLDGVAPDVDTITSGDYPLSRPLFIYVSTAAIERPEVEAFVRYYLENGVSLAESQQFVPAPQEALDEGLASLPSEE